MGTETSKIGTAQGFPMAGWGHPLQPRGSQAERPDALRLLRQTVGNQALLRLDSSVRAAPLSLGRAGPKQTPSSPPPPSPLTAAVRIDQHKKLVRDAVERLATLAGPGTFGPAMVPVFRALVDKLTYRLGSTDHLGESLEVHLPGRKESFYLRLVLDDKPNPWEMGYFLVKGNHGSIALNLTPPSGGAGTPPLAEQSVDEVASLLHHEALHMFRYWWLLPGAQLRFSDAQRTVLDLNAAEQLRPILEQNLQTILRDLNTSRRRRAQLPPEVLKRKASKFAESLAEEAIVRGETSFMAALGLHREQRLNGLGDPGSEMGIWGKIDNVSRYLFESGSMLKPEDRQKLSEQGRKALDTVEHVLTDIERWHRRMRWGGRE
jgi:hypothetical protein